MLPRHPLFCGADVQRIFKPEFMVRIEVAGQVIEDGQRFHHSVPAFVVIDNDWNAAIRAKFDKPWVLLMAVLKYVEALVRVFLAISFLKLLKQDRDLETWKISE